MIRPHTVCVSSSPAYIHSNQIMGWGEKAIEIRSVETGHLDGVFMHKRAQRLKFLCERNDKVKATKQGLLKMGNPQNTSFRSDANAIADITGY